MDLDVIADLAKVVVEDRIKHGDLGGENEDIAIVLLAQYKVPALIARVRALEEENSTLKKRVDAVLTYREAMEGLPHGTIPR